MKTSDKKRENVLTKQEAYMLIARLISKRSKDPNTQVGAVIVSKEDRILSIGYNGFPNGCSDDDFPWAREAENEYDTKYPYVCHSELNAILNFRGDNNALVGSTLYVTLFPCHECAKAIIQAGIGTIYYDSNKYKDTPDNMESIRMLNAAGVKLIHFSVPDTGKVNGLIDAIKTNDNQAKILTDEKSPVGVGYCSNCYYPIDGVSSEVHYCYHCGRKFTR